MDNITWWTIWENIRIFQIISKSRLDPSGSVSQEISIPSTIIKCIAQRVPNHIWWIWDSVHRKDCSGIVINVERLASCMSHPCISYHKFWAPAQECPHRMLSYILGFYICWSQKRSIVTWLELVDYDAWKGSVPPSPSTYHLSPPTPCGRCW